MVMPTPKSKSVRVTAWGETWVTVQKHGRDVGEDAEERRGGEDAHRQDEQDLWLAEDAELVEEAAGACCLRRDEKEDGSGGDKADGDDGPEGGSPAEGLP